MVSVGHHEGPGETKSGGYRSRLRYRPLSSQGDWYVKWDFMTASVRTLVNRASRCFNSPVCFISSDCESINRVLSIRAWIFQMFRGALSYAKAGGNEFSSVGRSQRGSYTCIPQEILSRAFCSFGNLSLLLAYEPAVDD